MKSTGLILLIIIMSLMGCETEFRYPPTEIPPVPQENDKGVLHIYEDPEGFPGVPKSGIYEVAVKQGRKEADLVVFRNACPEYQAGYMDMLAKDQKPLDKFRGRSISWVNFSFDGSVEITVTVADPEKVPMSGTVRILPSRYGISSEVEGNTIRFTLSEPGQFSVEIGEDSYKNGLVIFANPVETDIPSEETDQYQLLDHADAADIASVPPAVTGIWFKTGVHDIGIYRVPGSVRNIYLEGGAWVYGTFIMDGNPGVKIFGRGVLSAGRINYRASHTVEAINQSDNITLKGIVVEDSKHFSVRLIGMNNLVEWVKVIGGWVYNVDGIAAYAGSNVSHCFIWANDDNIKVYRDDITFSDIVCWQLDNGAVIQMSWGGAIGGSTARNVRISRIDVLHAEWDQSRFNSGLLNCVGNRYHDPGRYALQEDWLIEDVVTEFPVPQIINIRPDDFTPNHIHGLYMKNWNVRMDMSTGFPNNILGNDPEVWIDGVVFDNFVFNDTRFTASNWMNLGNFTLENLADPEFY
jgi:hypothetical protein